MQEFLAFKVGQVQREEWLRDAQWQGNVDNLEVGQGLVLGSIIMSLLVCVAAVLTSPLMAA